jgi:hypothetical protein
MYAYNSLVLSVKNGINSKIRLQPFKSEEREREKRRWVGSARHYI